MKAAKLLREANDQDARAVTDLWTKAYVNEGEGGRTVPYAEADFFDTTRHARVFVAERDGAVIGVVALAPPGEPEPAVAEADEAELTRLVVSASARNLGIGRALIGHCHELARTAGWNAIALWSRPYQEAAHRLYESLGYRRRPERDRSDDSGHARLVFRLTL
jgi:GNAT superfamily N-acetyltransferase